MIWFLSGWQREKTSEQSLKIRYERERNRRSLEVLLVRCGRKIERISFDVAFAFEALRHVGRQTNKTRKKIASKKFRSITRRKIAFQILFQLQSLRLHICHFFEQFKCHVSVKCQSARWLSLADTPLTNASLFDFNYNFNLRLISWVIQVRILIKMTTASSLFNCHMNGTWNQTSGGEEERDLCRDPRRFFIFHDEELSVAIESIEEKAKPSACCKHHLQSEHFRSSKKFIVASKSNQFTWKPRKAEQSGCCFYVCAAGARL